MVHQHGHGGGKRKKAIRNQDLILMVSTFLIGIMAGGYLYIVGFAPQFSDYLDDNQTESVYEDFVIDGEMYGLDTISSTASFQVLKNGSFRYIPAGEIDSANIKEGLVPKSIWADIKNNLTEKNLTTYVIEQEQLNCPTLENPGYRYAVTLNSKKYSLDTCKTNFSSNNQSALALENLWNYFRNLP